MPHTPHLFLAQPWSGESIDLSPSQSNHLFKVLRLHPGGPVSYTDGQGRFGSGELTTTHVARGAERMVSPPLDLEIAVVPPHERERVRFLVEKAAELEVRRVRWLRSRFGNARPKHVARAGEWAIAALEQSRGAWLTHIEKDWARPRELDDRLPTWVADRDGGRSVPTPPLRVVVGPEGGWADAELPASWPRMALGRNILRTETAVVAAIVAVSSHSTIFSGD